MAQTDLYTHYAGVRFHPYATATLKQSLAFEIRREAYEGKPPPDYQDMDSLHAALYLIEDDLKGIDHIFTKHHMLGRIDSALKKVRDLISALEKGMDT